MVFNKSNSHYSAHYASYLQDQSALDALRQTQTTKIITSMDIGKSIRAARKAKGMNLEQLAHIVETDSGNLSRLERGLQGASQELLVKIMDALDLTISTSSQPAAEEKLYAPSESDYALINQYSAVGECGGGYLNDHVELRDGLAFKRDWLARIGAKAENLAVIYATGDSMEPYIFDGDVVLFDTSDTEPKHGQVFVVRRPDYSLSIKRLVLQLSGDWLIKSDNADRTDEKVSSDTISEIPFVGRVIWRGGNIS